MLHTVVEEEETKSITTHIDDDENNSAPPPLSEPISLIIPHSNHHSLLLMNEGVINDNTNTYFKSSSSCIPPSSSSSSPEYSNYDNNNNTITCNNSDINNNNNNNGRARNNSKLSIYTDGLSIMSSASLKSISPSIQTQQSQQDWFFIENVDFPVGTQLSYDEGNTLDYKLTIFSDYMNFKTTNKEESQKLEKELIADNIGSLEKTPITEQSPHVQFVLINSPTTSSTNMSTNSNNSSNSSNNESGVIDYAKLGERMTEYLIAYLNSNGGALIFGVRDDGVVMGMKLSEKQRDKIRLMFDNCIRNFQITPAPRVALHYRLEFKRTTNVPSLWIMILEVKKSDFFHYAHIRSHLKSWERLSASNFCLCDRPQRFVERLRELRSTQEYQVQFNNTMSSIGSSSSGGGSGMSRRNSISSNSLNQQASNQQQLKGSSSPKRMIDGYFTLVFSDCQLSVCEAILARVGFDKRIYRLESYCGMDEQGRFLVDRPSKFFKLIYQFLQIGYVSVKMYDWIVFKLEAEYYGLDHFMEAELGQTTIEYHNDYVILKMVKGTHIHTSISQASLSNKIGTPLLNNSTANTTINSTDTTTNGNDNNQYIPLHSSSNK